MPGGTSAVVDQLRAVVWGSSDTRVRATYRVLLAWPILWFVVGTIAVGVGASIVPTGATKSVKMTVFGLLQGAFFAGAWVVWARYLDRRPLADYGLSVSRSWLLDLLAGFGAVLVGTGIWLGAGSALGWTSVEVSLTTPQGSLVVGLAGVFVGVIVNVWVQETVFFGVILTNASEGLSWRGVEPSRAIVGAWIVAVLLFALKHRPEQPEVVLNLLVALGVFGLLYVHTGELALPIGVHTGVNYAGHVLVGSPSLVAEGPTILQVTKSLSGLLGSLSDGAIPQILMAYLLLLAWIAWRSGGVSIEEGPTQRKPR